MRRRLDDFFGNGVQEIRGVLWDWEHFKTTEGFPVSDKLLDWIIGQDKALQECYLCLDEWINKVKRLQKEQWWKDWEKAENVKPAVKKKLAPGPFLLLLGDPGTGKSLIGRALAEKLTELYKTHNIQLYDVLCWKNPVTPSEPRISIHKAGDGKKIVKFQLMRENKKGKLIKWSFRFLTGIMIVFGLLMILTILFFLTWNWINPDPNLMYSPLGIPVIVQDIEQAVESGFVSFHEYWATHGGFIGYFINGLISNAQLLYLGIGSLSMGAMLFIFKHFLGRLGGQIQEGIGGAKSSDAPKLLIESSSGQVPFIDATGHGSAQLFGSIAWDPYQTGGLGTPEHQRVTAGDVHRANLGILFIDEIKNLRPDEVITLLTALEDGQLPITIRSMWHGADTAAMAVSTEPVPCVFFLIGAGNFDSLPQIHPALMDRIIGYGKIVMMNNDIPDTVENRRKYVQFIAQETQRFGLLPLTRGACIEVIKEARRRSGKRDALSTRFRPLISIIKTASVLASREGSPVVDVKHIREAIDEHCKSIQRQLLEQQLKERGKYLEIEPRGTKKGVVYGLAVITSEPSGETVGTVLRVKAQMVPVKGRKKGYIKVTGIAKDGTWIQDSIDKVRSVILKRYNKDVAEDYCTHIDFSQSHNVDGPSAGVTMTVLLCSLLEGKKIRQDVAITGEINVSEEQEIEVTAIGGVHEKIKAAEAWGFKKVVIPEKNYLYSIDPTDYKIQVVSARTLDDYLREVLVED